MIGRKYEKELIEQTLDSGKPESGIQSREYSWRSRDIVPGAQIDMLIDRNDNVINICEMKYSKNEFTIDSSYEKDLINKLECFRKETHCKKALHLTMITSDGLTDNIHSHIVLNRIKISDFFE